MRYTIDYKIPQTHFINLRIETKSTEDEEYTNLQLPAWRPGRYQLGNFAKNIRNFRAYSETREPLQVRKQSKDLWRVDTSGVKNFYVEYEFFAHKMDAGSSWLDEEQLYINPVNCCMYVPDREPEGHELRVVVPDSYRIACGMKETGRGVFIAKDFQELADSPLMASDKLTEWTYNEGDTEYHLWFMGQYLPEKEKTIEIFRDFTEAQTNIMGPLPIKDYHFMFQILPYRHYHGVEHRTSTVITLGPDTEIRTDALYKHFVGVSSHELFHAWNVCRLRPAELFPYDFSKEAYFDTGFIAEGVTTYY
ncbi:MAG: M61 family peptidase, partial [Cyclobacteriaceae bacterium]